MACCNSSHHTYYMGRLTPRKVQLWHKMELISTSLCCERLVYEPSRTDQDVLMEADGMAGPSFPDALQLYSDGSAAEELQDSSSMAEASSSSSSSAVPPLPLLSVPAAGSVTSSVISSSVTTSLGLGSAADRAVRDTIAGITSAEIAGSHPNSKDVKAASSSTGTKCPSEWFVCDDEAAATRYFVIQGSDSLDHWKTNLMFEPVVFEDADLGIKVHRGAYEAAQALYERFLPLVQEQVDSDPCARVAFTGHSIGGAMAVMLMIMFRRRGVLGPQQIAPVYTFGAPAIFCDGALGTCSACVTQPDGSEACSLGGTLLARLGLSEDIIRCCIATRDIVPRAFSCDYSPVAELLRSWGPSWREHSCLAGGATGAGRRQLYVHIGRMLVLQPSPELRFITEPNPHLPVLPQQPGVYELLHKPRLTHAMAAAKLRTQALRNGAALGPPATSQQEVLAAIMDGPHPLETLADPGAYGSAGSISRYHNPDNYTKALGRVLADRREGAAKELRQAPFVVPGCAAKHRPFFPAAADAAALDMA
ncbi:hypothetical protein OEZ85_006440 [Tetradesmus obliquus]|uniref:Fungal lipase-type domain-containing protein n=1 Tax=Tetradesmus obliquus TaxID=3088 RepID=A0ABY8TUJ8_TETOB|nr:hypothetical protein OEZ85_006440 [Tetradesmus obliquus]